MQAFEVWVVPSGVAGGGFWFLFWGRSSRAGDCRRRHSCPPCGSAGEKKEWSVRPRDASLISRCGGGLRAANASLRVLVERLVEGVDVPPVTTIRDSNLRWHARMRIPARCLRLWRRLLVRQRRGDDPGPSGVRVWLAVGRHRMRKGLTGLALQGSGVGPDPHAGDRTFRAPEGDLLKISMHDGIGMSLYAKAAERGPVIRASTARWMVAITAAQLAYIAGRGRIGANGSSHAAGSRRLRACRWR